MCAYLYTINYKISALTHILKAEHRPKTCYTASCIADMQMDEYDSKYSLQSAEEAAEARYGTGGEEWGFVQRKQQGDVEGCHVGD